VIEVGEQSAFEACRDFNAACVNAQGDYGSPLYEAAWRGKNASVAALIALGADVNKPGLLHAAASNNHLQIVRQLFAAGADPSQVNQQGKTAYEVAKAQGHVAVVRVFETTNAGSRLPPQNHPDSLSPGEELAFSASRHFEYKPRLSLSKLGGEAAQAGSCRRASLPIFAGGSGSCVHHLPIVAPVWRRC